MSVTAAWLNALSDRHLQFLTNADTLERARDQLLDVQGLHVPPLEPGEEIAAQATVQGMPPCTTRIWINTDHELDGNCTCPHATEGYFCQHQVAIGIILRHMLADQPMPWLTSAQASGDPAGDPPVMASASQNFLTRQPQAVLADKLWQWAQTIPHLMTAIELWAQQSQTPPTSDAPSHAPPPPLPEVRRLKQQISNSVESASRDASGWHHECEPDLTEIDKMLDQLQALQHQPVVLRELCEHAWEEMAQYWEELSDDEGELGNAFDRLLDLLHQSLQDSPPPADWFDTWMTLMDNDPLGAWSEAQTLAVAGPAVQARYIERASRDWQQWQTDMDTRGFSPLHRNSVRERYLRALALQGDVQGQIDTMSQHLAHVHEYLALADLLATHGRLDDAVTQLETAHHLHPNEQAIENRLLVHYDREGRHTDALTLRRQRLEACPSTDNYLAALHCVTAAGHDESAYRTELHAWATQHEQPAARAHARSWDDARTHLLMRWWLAENQPLAAFMHLDEPDTCSTKLLEQLSLALPASHHTHAVQLLQHLLERHMPHANSPYTETLSWVEQAGMRMSPTERATWLHQLRQTYKRKRNFIQGMNEMSFNA